jgi:hypothetical protein
VEPVGEGDRWCWALGWARSTQIQSDDRSVVTDLLGLHWLASKIDQANNLIDKQKLARNIYYTFVEFNVTY